ncbi:MAG: PASTA domain-containing protein [Pseudomonadota bacterium]
MDPELAGLFVRIQLLDSGERPITGTVLAVQMYQVRKQAWVPLLEMETDRGGIGFAQMDAKLEYPPALRVVLGNEPELIVGEGVLFGLAEMDGGPYLVYDFGAVEFMKGQEFVINPIAKETQGLQRVLTALPNIDGVPVKEIAAVMKQPAGRVGTGVGTDTVIATGALSDRMTVIDTGDDKTMATFSEKDREVVSSSLILKDQVITAKTVEITTLLGELNRTKSDNSQLTSDLRARERELDELGSKWKQVQEQQAQLESENSAQRRQIETLNGQLDTVSSRFKGSDSDRAMLEAELESAQEKIKALETQLADAETRKSSLEAERSREVELNTVQSQLLNGLAIADQSQVPGNYKLARMQVNLKALVTGDGGKLNLANADALKDAATANALSDISVEYLPSTASSTPVDDNMLRVPNLKGLTVTAARQVLRSLGAQMEAATGRATDADKVSAGQAFKQYPEAEATAAKGSTVMVVFHAPTVTPSPSDA